MDTLYLCIKLSKNENKVNGTSKSLPPTLVLQRPLLCPLQASHGSTTSGSEPSTLMALSVNTASSERASQKCFLSTLLPKTGAHEEVGPCLILTSQFLSKSKQKSVTGLTKSPAQDNAGGSRMERARDQAEPGARTAPLLRGEVGSQGMPP